MCTLGELYSSRFDGGGDTLLSNLHCQDSLIMVSRAGGPYLCLLGFVIFVESLSAMTRRGIHPALELYLARGFIRSRVLLDLGLYSIRALVG